MPADFLAAVSEFREFRHTIARLSGAPPADDAADAASDGDDESPRRPNRGAGSGPRAQSVSLPPVSSTHPAADVREPIPRPPPVPPDDPSPSSGLFDGLTSMIFDAPREDEAYAEA